MSNNQKRSKKPENLILKAKVHMRKWCEEVLPLLQLVTPLFVDEAWSPPECKVTRGACEAVGMRLSQVRCKHLDGCTLKPLLSPPPTGGYPEAAC